MPKIITMKKSEYDRLQADKYRKQFLQDPPEGYSTREIADMPDGAILDMAYFLSEGEWDEDWDHEEPEVIIQLIDDDPPDPPDLPF
jgi:hypothetical protein